MRSVPSSPMTPKLRSSRKPATPRAAPTKRPKRRLKRASILPLLLPFLALLHFVTTPKPALPEFKAPPNSPQAELEALLETREALMLQDQPRTNSKYILWRALGNDLPPRHERGQTMRNVKFILEHEPLHENLERRWLLNRIVKAEDELMVVKLLILHGERFVRLPLDLDEYARVDFDLGEGDWVHERMVWAEKKRRMYWENLMHSKNQFVMHNNQARNVMLAIGRGSGAKYVLPWDGNCYLTERAWGEIRYGVEGGGKGFSKRYFAVNMTRMTSNEPLLKETFRPLTASEEPQLIFSADSSAVFNEEMRYGSSPKVEMLWRLGIGGWWDKSPPEYGPWKRGEKPFVPDLDGVVRRVGWVARLFSGVRRLEVKKASIMRGQSRAVGVETLLAEANRIWAERRLGWNDHSLMLYDEDALERNRQSFHTGGRVTELVDQLLALADAEMARKAVYHVAGEGRDANEYVPNDSQTWGYFYRNVSVLTLAGYFTRERGYTRRAGKLFHAWFIANATKMHAHPRRLRNGIAAFNVLPAVFDMVRLNHKLGGMDDDAFATMREWARMYARYLRFMAKDEYYAMGDRGAWLDVQLAGASALAGDFKMLLRHTSLARMRLRGGGGVWPWLWLERMGGRIGVDVWGFEGVLDERVRGLEEGEIVRAIRGGGGLRERALFEDGRIWPFWNLGVVQ